jgi:hypothetical protein
VYEAEVNASPNIIPRDFAIAALKALNATG